VFESCAFSRRGREAAAGFTFQESASEKQDGTRPLYWSTVGKVQALSFLASYHMSESHEAACGERTWQQLLRWLVELLVGRVIETDRAIDNTFYPS